MLKRYLLSLVRSCLQYTPASILRQLASTLRYIVINSLHCDDGVKVEKFDTTVNILKLKSHDHILDECLYVIVYIHGGAFSLCDSADILLFKQLLPLIRNKLSDTKCVPIVYSILYDTTQSDGCYETLFATVQRQIIESYDKIFTTFHPSKEKKVIAIVGDSAGGNLAVNLVFQLQSRMKKLPTLYQRDNCSGVRLCLLSPWLHLFSHSASYSSNATSDIIGEQWLAKCRRSYLGDYFDDLYGAASLPIDDSADRPLPLAVSPLLAPAHLLRTFPPCLLLAGDREIFYDDILSFLRRVSAASASTCELLVGPEQTHVYPVMNWLTRCWWDSPAADAALQAMARHIAAGLCSGRDTS